MHQQAHSVSVASECGGVAFAPCAQSAFEEGSRVRWRVFKGGVTCNACM